MIAITLSGTTCDVSSVYIQIHTDRIYLSEAPINAPGRIGMWRFGATDKPHGNTPIANNVRVYDRFINKKLYELTDQTGNVRVVITDRKRVNGSDEAKPDIAMSAQYYPYGMAQAGRVASAGADYRYGYNGMEEEDRGDAVSSEIASTGAKAKPGEANLLNTEFRLYDPRLGQWLTPDPVFQPWESPYSAMAGNPILFSDPQGLNEEEGAKPGNTNTGKGTEENPGTVPEVVVRPPPIGLTNSTESDIVGARSEQGYDGWNYLNWMGNDVRYAGRSGIYTFQYYDRQYDSYREFTPYTDNEYSQLRLKIANQIADNGPYVLLGGFAAPFVGVVAVKGVGLALTPIVARGVPYIPYVYNIASKPETKEFVVDLMLGDGPGVSNPFTPAGAGKELVTNPVPT